MTRTRLALALAGISCIAGGAAGAAYADNPDADGITQTSGSGIIVAPGYNETATVSITAPTAGHVLVTGWTTAFGLATDQSAFARLRDTASGIESLVQGARLASGDHAVLSVGWIFEVEAGERVFALDTKGVGGTINTGSSTIIAVFLPD
jgi:hypothetical protein